MRDPRPLPPLEPSVRALIARFRARRPMFGPLDNPWHDPLWVELLEEAGLTAPAWPQRLGGAALGPTDLQCFHALVRGAFPGCREPAVIGLLGPMLAHAEGSAALDADLIGLLAGLLAAPMRVVVGVLDDVPHATLEELAYPVSLEAGRAQLAGGKRWVDDVSDPTQAIVLVRMDETQAAVLALPAAAIGQTRPASVDGYRHIRFDAREVDLLHPPVLVPLAAAQDAWRRYWLSLPGSGAAASALLTLVDQALDEEGLHGELSERRNEVAQAVAGLKALEARVGDNDSTSALRWVVARRALEVQANLSALIDDTFGYYSVPKIDLQLAHNEGPVGPALAAAVMRHRAVCELASGFAADVVNPDDAPLPETEPETKR